MASGHVNRKNRPNTWAHRPILHTRRKSLPTRSRPHREGEADMPRKNSSTGAIDPEQSCSQFRFARQHWVLDAWTMGDCVHAHSPPHNCFRPARPLPAKGCAPPEQEGACQTDGNL